jgi:hypothetical protein
MKNNKRKCSNASCRISIAYGGKSINMVDDDQWRFNITLTAIQSEQFKQYAITVLKKTFKCNKSIAISILIGLIFFYSLKLKIKKV